MLTPDEIRDLVQQETRDLIETHFGTHVARKKDGNLVEEIEWNWKDGLTTIVRSTETLEQTVHLKLAVKLVSFKTREK